MCATDILLVLSQEGTLEASLQPEDHGGGPPIHKQPQRVVTLWRPSTPAQRHERHSEPRAEE